MDQTLKCKLGENGEITINLLDAIRDLPDEQKFEIAESISCSDYVVESVCAQILEGYTPRYRFWGTWSTAYDAPLQRARALIANNPDGATKRHVEELERRVKHAEEQAEKYRQDYFKLYHETIDQRISARV